MRPWRGVSVRARTTVLATALVAVGLAVGAAILIATLDGSLLANRDGIAKARVDDLASLAERDSLPAVLTNVDDDGVAQVIDAQGRVLAASPNIAGAGPIGSMVSPGSARPVVSTLRNAPDDKETETYRVWARSADSPQGPVTIYVGSSTESVPEASRTLRRALLTGVPLTVLLIAGVTWVLVGRALRPVEAIRSEVAVISDGELSRRVPVPPADDEVGRLASTMNDMLDRLEASRLRQREFVSDASHELQSPLAAIRAQVEVALAHPESARWEDVARDVLDDCAQVERLVQDLLYLARAGEIGGVRVREPLDLDVLVLEEATRARSVSNVEIDTSRVSAAPVLGNAEDLRRLVRNLLENAIRHARHSVRLSASTSGRRTRFDVADDGPGVRPEERELVFERFYRGDPARSRGADGTGLGLAIARTIAESHGGTIRVDSPGFEAASDGGARFSVDLPSDAAGRTKDPGPSGSMVM
jgi:signal transduction histidine kinase